MTKCGEKLYSQSYLSAVAVSPNPILHSCDLIHTISRNYYNMSQNSFAYFLIVTSNNATGVMLELVRMRVDAARDGTSAQLSHHLLLAAHPAEFVRPIKIEL